MLAAFVTLADWEANITIEFALMVGMVLVGIFIIWLIQRLTGGYDKRGD